MDELKVGDIATLKSDGPMMTVEKIDPDGMHVECAWFEPSGHGGFDGPLRGVFVRATLRRMNQGE